MGRYELNQEVLVMMYEVTHDSRLSEKDKSEILDKLENEYVTIEKDTDILE